MYRLDGRELLVKTFGVSQPIHDERPAKCPILRCEFHTRGFAREYDKQRHILTHYKSAIICPFCPVSGSAAERSFDRIEIFKRHLTSVHSVERLPPNSQAQGRGQVINESERELLNPYGDACGDCAICGTTFTNAQHFYEHLDSCVVRSVKQGEPIEAIEQSIEGQDLQGTGLYRISQGGMVEIEEAIAFNV
jgi:hypothetical protein